jgi:hypothetical protein
MTPVPTLITEDVYMFISPMSAEHVPVLTAHKK